MVIETYPRMAATATCHAGGFLVSTASQVLGFVSLEVHPSIVLGRYTLPLSAYPQFRNQGHKAYTYDLASGFSVPYAA